MHTSGDCSPAIYGSHNVIDCGSLSKSDAAILASILNEARASNKSLSEIKELIEKALDPNRTITGYLPDGQTMLTNNAAGVTVSVEKGEHDVFVDVLNLEKQRKWKEVLALAQAEEVKVPGWFTMHVVEGDAYLGLCKLQLAIAAYDKFISEVAHIGNYDEMSEKVKKRREQLNRFQASGTRSCPFVN